MDNNIPNIVYIQIGLIDIPNIVANDGEMTELAHARDTLAAKKNKNKKNIKS